MENVNKHQRVLVKVLFSGSHINKKLSKQEKKHDMTCKEELDKFDLLILDTAGIS